MEVLVPKPRTTALLWMYLFLMLTIKEGPVTWGRRSVKVTVKKVPVKRANATNLNYRFQTHHPQQHTQLFLKVQKVEVNDSLFIRVFRTPENRQ